MKTQTAVIDRVAHSDALIDSEFPIESETSPADKLVLLQLRNILRTLPSYSFLEIGSYIGGSLTPFLRDPQCSEILSIDERGRYQPDARGRKFDYTTITHQTMIDTLTAKRFDVRKLETFDGSVNEYAPKGRKFDLVFIDGEHTDRACFRDFIHSRGMFKDNCVVAFHDSTLVYKALQIIQEYLTASSVKFRFVKVAGSEMSCIFLNDFSLIDIDGLFSAEQDLDAFYANSEIQLLMANINNRLAITYEIKEPPTA